jgi:beta-lactamase class D
MYILKSLKLLILSLLIANIANAQPNYSKIFNGVEPCFILYDLNQEKTIESFNSTRCKEQIPPMCSFNIALSLMGFDSGILKDENNPEWKFKQEYLSAIDSHNKDHTPKSWLANSVVWYSKILTKKLGMTKFKEYATKFSYGNEDLSGNPGKNDGLTNAWLNSSLKISGEEQIDFLKKFITHKLPVKDSAIKHTKNIMFIEELPNGFKLYGKTGGAIQKNTDGSDKEHMGFGWFVGFLEKEGQTYIFAVNIHDQQEFEQYAGPRAKAMAKEIFASLDMLK